MQLLRISVIRSRQVVVMQHHDPVGADTDGQHGLAAAVHPFSGYDRIEPARSLGGHRLLDWPLISSSLSTLTDGTFKTGSK